MSTNTSTQTPTSPSDASLADTKSPESTPSPAFYRTVIASSINSARDLSIESGYRRALSNFLTWRRLLISDIELGPFDKYLPGSPRERAAQVVNALTKEAQAYQYSSMVRISNKRFCVTREGRIGLVPLAAAVGDVIALFGGGVAHALRKPGKAQGDGGIGVGSELEAEDWYGNLGNCYTDGIMDGEVFVREGAGSGVEVVDVDLT